MEEAVHTKELHLDGNLEINLEHILEAVIHAADEPISVQRLIRLFNDADSTSPGKDAILAALETLQRQSENRPVALVKIGQGYRYQTRQEFSPWITKLYAVRPPRLSRALLETLAIIAYQQPVTRGDIQAIRGISVSADIMQRLMERGWVEKTGEKEAPGRPSLYGTSQEFLSYFGLSSLEELPEIMPQRELSAIAQEMNLPLDDITDQQAKLPEKQVTENSAENSAEHQ